LNIGLQVTVFTAETEAKRHFAQDSGNGGTDNPRVPEFNARARRLAMRKGRQLAARLEVIAALERWATAAERGAATELRLTRHQRRVLGCDCMAVGVAISACRLQHRAPAPTLRCLARVMRERCRE
jgi:hypothetical protein